VSVERFDSDKGERWREEERDTMARGGARKSEFVDGEGEGCLEG
jgi:hypothetical protein